MTRRFLIGATGVTLAALVAVLTDGHTLDFGFDWLTARAMVTGIDPHTPLKVLAEQFGSTVDSVHDFIAPRTPGALLIQAPVGWVPLEHGYQVGRLLTVGSFAGFMWVVSRLSGLRTHWLLAAMPALLFVWPFSVVMAFSQTSLFVAALIGLTWLISSRTDSLLAGVPLSAAICFKVWPWLVVPALWLAGYRKSALGAASGFAALNLGGLAFPNVTLSGTVAALTQAQSFPTWSIWTGVPSWVGGTVGLLIIIGLSRVVAPRATVMLAVVVALVVAPVLWPHYFVALFVPIVVGLRVINDSRQGSHSRPLRNGQTSRVPVLTEKLDSAQHLNGRTQPTGQGEPHMSSGHAVGHAGKGRTSTSGTRPRTIRYEKCPPPGT